MPDYSQCEKNQAKDDCWDVNYFFTQDGDVSIRSIMDFSCYAAVSQVNDGRISDLPGSD
jgi:hypothetical protein